MVLDEPRKEDEIVHIQGIDVVYDGNEKALFDQTVIDYRDSWYGEGFVVCSPASEPCQEPVRSK
jgi:Fe-S cluster assembly iron-binding protein IscA